METGGLLILLPGRNVLFPLICLLPFATEGSRLALGCLYSRRPTPGRWLVSCVRPFHLSPFSVAGFPFLELKRLVFFLYVFSTKNTDDRIRFCSKY